MATDMCKSYYTTVWMPLINKVETLGLSSDKESKAQLRF